MESGGNDAPAKVEQKEEDILDSWEDCLESVDLWIPFLEVSIRCRYVLTVLAPNPKRSIMLESI